MDNLQINRPTFKLHITVRTINYGDNVNSSFDIINEIVTFYQKDKE